MNFFKKALVYAGILGIGLSSCEKELPPGFGVPEEELVLNENTVILNSSELKEISNYSSNSLTFNESQSYEKGDFIVAGVSENTPRGLLKKINSVSNDKKKFGVSNTSIEEVLLNGEFDYSKTLTMNDVSKGSDLKSSKIGFTFSYPIDKIIYDFDGSLSTTDDQVKISGNIDFDADFYLRPKFKKGLEKISFGTNINGKANLNFVSSGEFQIDKEINFYTQKFTPITVPGPLGFPIVLTPEIEINLGVVGGATAKLETGVVFEMNSSSDLTYKDGSWTKNEEFSKSLDPRMVNTLLNANLKAYGGPKMNLMVYESLGPFVSIYDFLRAEVDILDNPWWTLYGGIEGKIGVDMGIFSKHVGDIEKEIFNFENMIARSGGMDNSPPNAYFVVSPSSGTTDTNFLFDASESEDSETSVQNMLYRWDFEGDGIWDTEWTKGLFQISHKYSSPGTYESKLKIKDEGNYTGNYSLEVLVGQGNEKYFTDPRDGQVYKTVKIGDQVWMAENLNYSHEKSSYYQNDETYSEIYGRLYTWEAAHESCPSGWKLPDTEDWNELFSEISPSPKGVIKSKGTIEEGNGLWHSPNVGAENKFGFEALPGGSAQYSSYSQQWIYSDRGYEGNFWEKDNSECVYRFNYDSDGFTYSYDAFPTNNFQYSIRCIQEE